MLIEISDVYFHSGGIATHIPNMKTRSERKVIYRCFPCPEKIKLVVERVGTWESHER